MTHRYDLNGNKVSHGWRGSTASVALGLVVTIAFAVACMVIVWSMGHAKDPEEARGEQRPTGPRHDSMTITYTYDGEAIRYYVMVDPDTRKQYIVNDRGGMCLREDRDTPYPETSEAYRNGDEEEQKEETVVE